MKNPSLTPQWWLDGPHVRLGALPGSEVVVLERTARPIADEEFASVFNPVIRHLANLPRDRYGLLIDARAARGRNDLDFEKKFEPYRRSIQRGFRRVAILVTTPQGKLQASRYAREDGMPNMSFDDLGAALEWLETTPPT